MSKRYRNQCDRADTGQPTENLNIKIIVILTDNKPPENFTT